MVDEPCTCLICAGEREGRDAGIVATVEEHGWCSLRVAGTVEFAYTVGLWHSFRLPEITMFGLGGEGMQTWLNRCVGVVRDRGWPDTPFPGVIDGFEVRLRPVDESWRDAFFGSADRFYRGRPVPVWQLVWPDSAGRWPWDDGATVTSRTRQPCAWLPVEEHAAGGWRLLGEFGDRFPLPVEADSLALTTRSVLDGGRAPALVLFDDGVFDVLDERGYDAEDLCTTYVGTLVRRHPVLGGFGDLAEGTVATRGGDGTWVRATASAEQNAASVAGWQRGGEDRATP